MAGRISHRAEIENFIGVRSGTGTRRGVAIGRSCAGRVLADKRRLTLATETWTQDSAILSHLLATDERLFCRPDLCWPSVGIQVRWDRLPSLVYRLACLLSFRPPCLARDRR